MRVYMSYGRLFLASWLFLGGLAILFGPSPAGEGRRMRERERQLQTIPAEEQPRWIEERDVEDSRTQAYIRVLGVVMGGFGFAAALRETAYLSGRYGR